MESEEEKQRKQDIAEELLNEYDEYLNEDKKFEIENRLERMRLRRILSIQQRVEEEASADPEEEKRLARAVYEDDRFNRQFNETDTEMLLDDLDLEFDPNTIRAEEVHKRAKSLLKINRWPNSPFSGHYSLFLSGLCIYLRGFDTGNIRLLRGD